MSKSFLTKMYGSEEYSETYGWSKEFINATRDYDRIFKIEDGLAKVRNKDKFGVVNESGEIVMDIKYVNIVISKGLIFAKEDGLWSIYNSSAELISDYKYNGFIRFSGNVAGVRRDGKYTFVGLDGKEKHEPEYDLVYGNIIVKKGDKYAIVDENGNAITDFIYDKILKGIRNDDPDEIKYFSAKKGQFWGFVGSDGIERTQFKYRTLIGFRYGLAKFKNEDGKIGLMDTSFKEILEAKYDKIFWDGDVIVFALGNNIGVLDREANFKEVYFEKYVMLKREKLYYMMYNENIILSYKLLFGDIEDMKDILVDNFEGDYLEEFEKLIPVIKNDLL